MAKGKFSRYPLVPLSKEIIELVETSARDSVGQLDTLESAIGALIIGQSMGWRVLYIVHIPSTLTKYAKLLGIKSFKDHCPEVGPHAMRCTGFRWIQNASNFWKALKGEDSVVDDMPRKERLEIAA